MKIIHTSDWHLGRQFHNVSLLDDQRHALRQLVDHVCNEKVDALVIAGDIHDRSVPPAEAVALLDEVLHEVTVTLGVPVVLIPGNHDSAVRLSFGSRQMGGAGLHILGSLRDCTTPVELEGPHGKVFFYGVPYNDPDHLRSEFAAELAESGEEIRTHDHAHSWLVNRIANARDDKLPAVLVGHCFVDGASSSESERPLSVGGADRVAWQPMAPFNYVALGHLHAPQQQGAAHIRYSGSLLKYSFSEVDQSKGVTLVNLDEQGRASCSQLPIHPLHNLRVVEGTFDQILERGKDDPAREDYLLVRLTDNHAHLDLMNRLRVVYPNVLHVERPALTEFGERTLVSRDQLARSEFDIFSDFYHEMKGERLSEAQCEVLKDLISQLHREAAQQTGGDA